MHVLAPTSRSPGAGDAGGAGGPLPLPASPGRLRAAPAAARELPSLTAAAAAGEGAPARRLRPSPPRGAGPRWERRVASGKRLGAGVRRTGGPGRRARGEAPQRCQPAFALKGLR